MKKDKKHKQRLGNRLKKQEIEKEELNEMKMSERKKKKAI